VPALSRKNHATGMVVLSCSGSPSWYPGFPFPPPFLPSCAHKHRIFPCLMRPPPTRSPPLFSGSPLTKIVNADPPLLVSLFPSSARFPYDGTGVAADTLVVWRSLPYFGPVDPAQVFYFAFHCLLWLSEPWHHPNFEIASWL